MKHQIKTFSYLNEPRRRFFTHKTQPNYPVLDVVTPPQVCAAAINPWFVTGFIDGEGCFSINIISCKKSKTGWRVQLFFEIHLDAKDKAILEQIQIYFGGIGRIYQYRNSGVKFAIFTAKELQVIVNHCEKYPLITQKRGDFELWKKVLKLFLDKEHLIKDGLHKIVAIKASVNLGLSERLIIAFPDVTPVLRPLITNQKVDNPYWLAGFTSGEGCFMIVIQKSSFYKLGGYVGLSFTITQHFRDKELMQSLIDYLDCGDLFQKGNAWEYRVRKFSDIEKKIIPFFQKYPIKGVKSKDFEDFVLTAEIKKNKAHLTKEGFEQILKIKAGMNLGRVKSELESNLLTPLEGKGEREPLSGGLRGFQKKILLVSSQKRNLVYIRPKMNFLFKQLIFTRTYSNVAGGIKSSCLIQENDTNKLHPYFITGLTDAKSCFLINIRPNTKLKVGYSIELVFKITLHSRVLLENIRKYFEVGTVTDVNSGRVQYWVGSLKDLQVIVDHFDNYPLISHKLSDYQLFKQALDLMKDRMHLKEEGLQKIVSIKAVLNKGLSDNLIAERGAFLDIVPNITQLSSGRGASSKQIICSPHWISGFVSGNGCFFWVLKKSSKGGSVGFRFLVTQQVRDAELLKSLENYLGCGKYSIRSQQSSPMSGDYLVTKFNDIKYKIIPFFDKYPVYGEKSLDFSDLKQVLLLKESNKSLTKEILEKIQSIKSLRVMNDGRLAISKKKDSSNEFTAPIYVKTGFDKPNSEYKSGLMERPPLLSERSHGATLCKLSKGAVPSALPEAGTQPLINPWFLTGFTDGEGSFLIHIRGKKARKVGFSVELVFRINLHCRDRALLENIRDYFGVGRLTAPHDNCIQYWVGALNDLQVIINHFDNYPLITQKGADYYLFKQAWELLKLSEHLNQEGLKKIVSLRASLNKGLPKKLKPVFSDIEPALRPQISKKIPDPYWISGFVAAEGCFTVNLSEALGAAPSRPGTSLQKQHNKNPSLKFVMIVTQHVRDVELLKSFINYFGCGRYHSGTKSRGYFMVSKYEDIKSKIIPFFDEYPIKGIKYEDFLDFKKAIELKGGIRRPLTIETLRKIREIKFGMNKGRYNKFYSESAIYEVNSGSSNKMKIGDTKRYFSACAVYRACQIPGFEEKSLGRSANVVTHSLKDSLATIANKNLPCEATARYFSSGAFNRELAFKQWLAGLLDGDGEFKTTKKGSCSLKIIMGINDKSPLYQIKHKYGGSVKPISGSNALKYKLTNPKALISLINVVNGLIRNPLRMLQLYKICKKFNIELKEPQPLNYNNGWFSGLVDSDGSIHIDEKSGQLIISVTQKNKYLLEPLQKLYGGRIKIHTSKNAFIYSIYRKEEVEKLVDVYFKNFPLKSSKAFKINLIKDFYLKFFQYTKLRRSPQVANKIAKFNQWVIFKDKWDKIV